MKTTHSSRAFEEKMEPKVLSTLKIFKNQKVKVL
jgi:hypothetical protein